MSRAIKIFGIGFSADDNDAEIEVAVDGNIIYTGAVTTDTNFDLGAYLAGSDLGEEEVASWVEGDTATTKNLSIRALSGGFLYQAAASTNSGDENVSNLTLAELNTLFLYTDNDGSEVSDPNSNVLIDGEEYARGINREQDMFGQWSIGIPEGSTMTCTLNIGGEGNNSEDSTA